MDLERDQLEYYFHETVNFVVTALIFILLFLCAAKVIGNIASLFSIITI